MLPRRLEPEVMDTAEEARDYDEMDHSAVNQLFVTDFLAAWKRAAHEIGRAAHEVSGSESPILDVGTGTARIPIELCRRDARANVVGADLSNEMLKLGRANVAKAGLSERIKLDLVDAKGLPYADGSFAAVMSNSIVHHIPEPKSAVAEMVRVCQSGGLIFVRDLLRPATEAERLRLVDVYATEANDHQRQLFGDSLHAALTLAEVRDLVVAFGFDGATVTQTSDRHWTWIGTNAKS